jgi:hypothetical protein
LVFLAQLLTETRDSADVRGAICVSRRLEFQYRYHQPYHPC